MLSKKHRLIVPQYEFGFAAESFNLFQEITIDGERVARALERAAEAAGNPLRH